MKRNAKQEELNKQKDILSRKEKDLQNKKELINLQKDKES
jgi:hypothetical protein